MSEPVSRLANDKSIRLWRQRTEPPVVRVNCGRGVKGCPGGSEGGLMAVAGWTRPDMLLRYTKAQASARAADEARTLNLGEL